MDSVRLQDRCLLEAFQPCYCASMMTWHPASAMLVLWRKTLYAYWTIGYLFDETMNTMNMWRMHSLLIISHCMDGHFFWDQEQFTSHWMHARRVYQQDSDTRSFLSTLALCLTSLATQKMNCTLISQHACIMSHQFGNANDELYAHFSARLHYVSPVWQRKR